MKSIIRWSSLALVGLLSGCDLYERWQPTFDTRDDPDVQRLEQDKVECQTLARQGGSTDSERVQGGVAGSAVGTAAEATAGTGVGNAATGVAARGVGQTAIQERGGERQFKQEYINCMRSRGHHVIN